MAERPQKKLKGSSILKESPLVTMNRHLLPAILSPLTYRFNTSNEDFLAESEPLPATNEIDDCTSESQSDSESLMTDSPPDQSLGPLLLQLHLVSQVSYQ